MFVTYDCGCVGLVITQPSANGDVTTHLNLTHCGALGSDSKVGFSPVTGNAEKPFVPLDDPAAQRMIKRINSLIGDGCIAQTFKRQLSFIGG